MQTLGWVALAAGICAALASTACGAGATLYVAPGADRKEATGSRESPFTTLEQARDAVRAMKKAGGLPGGGVVIELQGAAYERDKPFELTAEDSGTEAAPVVYRSAPGQQVRIVGGRAVGPFTPVSDPNVLAQLDPNAHGHVLQADLKAQGIADYGKLTQRGFGQPMRPAHMELFFQDRPMTLARWPNDGYARIADVPPGAQSRPTEVQVRQFLYTGDRPRRWLAESDVWVYGYWYHDWADTYLKVESIDLNKRVITTTTRHNYGIRKGNRWHVLNVLGELDCPGEYYVDRQNGILYFWPPKPIREGKAIVSVAEQLITMTETSYVTIRGLILEDCRGTAVKIAGGSHDQIVGCTIRNTGNQAASIAGADHAVIGCDIYQTGDGGITLSGGDRKTLAPARLLAENNHIFDFSRWCHTYRPAVGVGGCGNIVRNNLLHHGPHSAIQLGGNDHLVEFNEIHSVCCDTGDVGAFYTGRDWTARGTVIRHNYWHHIQGPGIFGAMGVYLDDQASGFTILGNVFHLVTRAAFVGGGCDNTVENNVFVDCAPAVHIDARGLGWQKKATDDPAGELRRYLAAMPYRNELWSKRYPELVKILEDDPGTPKRNTVVRNISVGGKWEDIDAKTRKFQVVRDNLVDEDPQFVDRAKLDFRLKEGSAAFKLGFKPIPAEKIGLYKDERRASWPVVHKPREVPPPAAERKPVPAGPPPVFTARKSLAALTIDGSVDPNEWQAGADDKPMILKEDFHGEESARQSRAWLRHDGKCLYVGIENTVRQRPQLKKQYRWGADDAVELAIRNAAAGKDQPILILRGYLESDCFESSDEAGAPAAAVAKAKEGVVYKAKVAGDTLWTAEWQIPFASLGIDPAKHRTFAFNLSVRKTADDLWLQWRSTRGSTWQVDRAGVLKLGE